MFDAHLAEPSRAHHAKIRPSNLAATITMHVDGKKREDGVRSFLEQPRHRNT